MARKVVLATSRGWEAVSQLGYIIWWQPREQNRVELVAGRHGKVEEQWDTQAYLCSMSTYREPVMKMVLPTAMNEYASHDTLAFYHVLKFT